MSFYFRLILVWIQSPAIWSLGLLSQEFIVPLLKQTQRGWAGLSPQGDALQLGVSLAALPAAPVQLKYCVMKMTMQEFKSMKGTCYSVATSWGIPGRKCDFSNWNQSFSLPNCCLGAMKFLLTTGPQGLIINAMWLLPIANSVPLWGCEKDSFVNQGGKSAAVHTLHPLFSCVTPDLNADQTWLFMIWFICYSIQQTLSLLLGIDRNRVFSLHTKTSLEN